jgi:hypothetical protein
MGSGGDGSAGLGAGSVTQRRYAIPDLIALFNAVAPPTAVGEGTRYAAHPVPGLAAYRVGKDEQGSPAILVSVSPLSTPRRAVPVRLMHFTAQHDVTCTIQLQDGSIERDRLTIISCVGDDPILHAYFLRVLGAVISALGPNPSREDLDEAVAKLATLFHTLARPPRRTAQGLWAELLSIALASDPVMLAAAWHTEPHELYDFNAGAQRIEVKSSAGHVRRHHFRLEQLRPPKGTQVLVASLLVEPSAGGVTIPDLVDEIRTSLSTRIDLVERVDQILAWLMGSEWRDTLDIRFDRELAEQSLAFYDPSAIPQIAGDIPQGVSDITFVADLSSSTRVPADVSRALGGIFAAAIRPTT